MEETFKIRAYGYGELAQLYFPQITPKSAAMRLSRWISQSSTLQITLREYGHNRGQKVLTPKQVQLIVTEFGPPH